MIGNIQKLFDKHLGSSMLPIRTKSRSCDEKLERKGDIQLYDKLDVPFFVFENHVGPDQAAENRRHRIERAVVVAMMLARPARVEGVRPEVVHVGGMEFTMHAARSTRLWRPGLTRPIERPPGGIHHGRSTPTRTQGVAIRGRFDHWE